ncbi:MAG TPA: zinc ribbon domain-containing protein [Blastocatellia bacterium]
MPIFEYVCKTCNGRFEKLVQPSSAVECPSCKSTSLEKQLSVFSAGRGRNFETASPLSPCGTCGDPRGPGSCSLN